MLGTEHYRRWSGGGPVLLWGCWGQPNLEPPKPDGPGCSTLNVRRSVLDLRRGDATGNTGTQFCGPRMNPKARPGPGSLPQQASGRRQAETLVKMGLYSRA